MEDMASVWSYQEIIDAIKQKLLHTTLELEAVRAKAYEDMKMYQDYEKQSLQLLNMAIQERDDAREQLHNILNNLIVPSVPQLSPKSPLTNPLKSANSSITDSTSLSEPHHCHSQNSSPVESSFGTLSSPALSNINNNRIVNQPFNKVQHYDSSINATNFGLSRSSVSNIDEYSLVVDNLVKERTLPEKGKLLQNVLEAGPLLETHLVAGPLPRWRNPPPLQAFSVPPVSISGNNEFENIEENPNANVASQIMSNSLLSFGNAESGSLVAYEAADDNNVLVPTSKRQKFHCDHDH